MARVEDESKKRLLVPKHDKQQQQQQERKMRWWRYAVCVGVVLSAGVVRWTAHSNTAVWMTGGQLIDDAAFVARDVLPTNVRPTHYALRLCPDLRSFSFAGHADIDLAVRSPSTDIHANAADLDFVSASVLIHGQPSSRQDAVAIDVNKDAETVVFRFEKELPAGVNATLSIDFVGTHNDKMCGFYRLSYPDPRTGEKKYMVVTQFEPTDARKAFPCWDEPAIKATFDVQLVVPEELTALSNMNEIGSKKLEGGLKEVTFARSPIMSTYLVAFVVGELDYVQTTTDDAQKTLIRVLTLPGQAEQGKFALDVAAKTLTFFADYFDAPYPLPKLDMVATQLSAGGMENWGLILYRDIYLLYDEKTSAAKSKQSIAYVVAHELAHQWFGNLCTMYWWSDLWLNEGFATWVGWLAVNHIFPEWNVWGQFVTDDFQRGLSLDALQSSHPIEVPVKNPSEIHQIFDAISYSKGASVIRMLVNYLGEETFRKGMRAYLKKFKFANAETKDLWNSLSEASGKDVAQLMRSWTRQTGFPVVIVNEEKHGDGLRLKLRQERLLSSGHSKEFEQSLWVIPLQIFSSLSLKSATSDVLATKEGVFSIPGFENKTMGEHDFYKLNYQQNGFYRTSYPEKEWLKLGQAVVDKKLDISDRVGLVTDVFALSQAGYGSVVQGLTLLKSYKEEDSYIVWGEISARLGQIRSIWWEQPEEVTEKLRIFVKNTFTDISKKLGWEYDPKEDHLTGLLRTLVIAVAGKAGVEDVVQECKKRFKEFISGNTDAIHPNLRSAVFGTVLKYGGEEEYNSVVKLYRETKVADQKLIALAALGSPQKKELLEKTLAFAISDEVLHQDIIYVLGPVAQNPAGRQLAWEFVKNNWKFLYDRYYTGSMSLLGRIVSQTTEDFSSDAWAHDVDQFFASKELPAISRTIQQSLEKIRSNAKWLTREKEAVAAWLKANV